jgi:glycosyltransferase involved in cell wall biosynthesis
MPESSPKPAVSIILPTYNRAKFLPQAFGSIRSQTFTDWELIAVDDGSTDNTRELVAELTRGWPQPVHYVYQENQGPYAARNTGLDLARGEHVAFFDSDDVWLPHHLQDCVRALGANPEVDWVYGACQVVDLATGRELAPSTFYTDGKPRCFLKLRARSSGPLRVIDDPNVMRGMLSHGLYCGLQNSVIRRRTFDGQRFRTAYRNEAEDLLIVIRALAAGRRFGYLDNVHVVYHVHEANSSAPGAGGTLEKRLAIHRAMLRGFEDVRNQVSLSRAEHRALDRNLSRIYFWQLGYTLLWQHGYRQEALSTFRQAMRLWPWDPWFWKTYLLAWVRAKASRRQPMAVAARQIACPAGRSRPPIESSAIAGATLACPEQSHEEG